MKFSDEAFKALETQILTYQNRIDTYRISIERLSKMPQNDIVKKSIGGYETQIDYLMEKIKLLETDLTAMREINA